MTKDGMQGGRAPFFFSLLQVPIQLMVFTVALLLPALGQASAQEGDVVQRLPERSGSHAGFYGLVPVQSAPAVPTPEEARELTETLDDLLHRHERTADRMRENSNAILRIPAPRRPRTSPCPTMVVAHPYLQLRSHGLAMVQQGPQIQERASLLGEFLQNGFLAGLLPHEVSRARQAIERHGLAMVEAAELAGLYAGQVIPHLEDQLRCDLDQILHQGLPAGIGTGELSNLRGD